MLSRRSVRWVDVFPSNCSLSMFHASEGVSHPAIVAAISGAQLFVSMTRALSALSCHFSFFSASVGSAVSDPVVTSDSFAILSNRLISFTYWGYPVMSFNGWDTFAFQVAVSSAMMSRYR